MDVKVVILTMNQSNKMFKNMATRVGCMCMKTQPRGTQGTPHPPAETPADHVQCCAIPDRWKRKCGTITLGNITQLLKIYHQTRR